MKVRWTPEALRDRNSIFEYIAAVDRSAASRLDELFAIAAKHLSITPEMGREGSVPGTRQILPHRRYRLIYEIDSGTVWILALVHTARRWPPTSD